MDPRNVDTERNYVTTITAEVEKIQNVLIPNKKREVDNEQRDINALFEKQIEALREKAKTDPTALAALKELEAQQAAISGSKTKLIVFAVVGVVLLIIGTIIFIKIRKKSKASATA
jgi:vacuolar-type H+-ATPase subunit E/Vma4